MHSHHYDRTGAFISESPLESSEHVSTGGSDREVRMLAKETASPAKACPFIREPVYNDGSIAVNPNKPPIVYQASCLSMDDSGGRSSSIHQLHAYTVSSAQDRHDIPLSTEPQHPANADDRSVIPNSTFGLMSTITTMTVFNTNMSE